MANPILQVNIGLLSVGIPNMNRARPLVYVGLAPRPVGPVGPVGLQATRAPILEQVYHISRQLCAQIVGPPNLNRPL